MFSMREDQLLFEQMEQWIKQEKNDKVIFILEHTLSTDLGGRNGVTLLHLAATHGNLHIVEYLKSKEVIQMDVGDCFNTTPLMLAIQNRQWAVAKFLLEHNADIFATNNGGDSALLRFMKMRHADPQVFGMILDRVQMKTPNGFYSINLLEKVDCTVGKTSHLYNAKTAKLFSDWRAFARAATHSVDHNSVRVAMRRMDQKKMMVLLHHGQVVRKRKDFLNCLRQTLIDSYANTYLFGTVQMAIKQLVKWKLLSSATVRIMERIVQEQTEDGLRLVLSDSLVSYIKEDFDFDIRVHMFGNRNSCVLAMVKNGEADINALSRKGKTALHIATECGALDMMIYLLDCGMSPNVRDENGKTPIFTVLGNNTPCLMLLLLYGADLQACDNLGKTFLDFYKSWPSYRAVRVVVLAHLAILKSNGVSLKEPFRHFIVEHDSRDFFQTCCRTLEQMKTHKLHSSLTLFEVLAESIEYLSRRVRSLDHETIETFFSSSSLQKYGSNYVSVSRERLEKAVSISNLRNKAVAVIGDSVEILKPYDLVLNKICSYLTYHDLSFFA